MHPLSYPLARRKLFCIGFSVLIVFTIAQLLPGDIWSEVPTLYPAVIIHGLIVGWAITVAGLVNRMPFTVWPLHPLLRGGSVALFVHLGLAIHLWFNPPLFWRALFFAAAFGSLIDFTATKLFGDGKKLARGLVE